MCQMLMFGNNGYSMFVKICFNPLECTQYQGCVIAQGPCNLPLLPILGNHMCFEWVISVAGGGNSWNQYFVALTAAAES